MKFLVDAHLPARLVRLLNEHGHDATHTSEPPDGNRTPDDDIAATADAEDRVVVSMLGPKSLSVHPGKSS